MKLYELINGRRVHFVRGTEPENDALIHCLKVYDYADKHGCTESFDNALNRLACREDEVVILWPEDPLNFFWTMYSRTEYDAVILQYGGHAEFSAMLPGGKRRYHGGLIGHIVYEDGKPTDKREWSVHT